MPYISFVSDERFRAIVRDILAIGEEGKKNATEEFERNVIDPFSMLVEMVCFDMDYKTWVDSERSRQVQKTLSASIGLMHQKLLGSVNGWSDLENGKVVDLVNHERKIIAEIKNKHNTVKGSDKVVTYKELESLIMPKSSIYKGYTAYYVEIVPSTAKGYKKPFTPSDKKTGTKCEANPQIIIIDGLQFYDLVACVDGALIQVFNALPQVLKDCKALSLVENTKDAMQFFKSAYVPKPPRSQSRSRHLKSK